LGLSRPNDGGTGLFLRVGHAAFASFAAFLARLGSKACGGFGNGKYNGWRFKAKNVIKLTDEAFIIRS